MSAAGGRYSTAPTPHLAFDGQHPHLADGAWAAPNATLIGAVHLAEGANVWYSAVLRGDGDTITVGRDSNIQDGCVLHADPGFPATIGDGVTVGHRAVVHGCTVEDHCLIGMSATLLNGCRVGQGSLVAAGTVLLEGTDIPPGSLVAGTPGKVRRALTTDEQAALRLSAEHYVQLAHRHRDALGDSDPA